MPVLYRVFPFLPGVGPTEPGGALHVPPRGSGRLDNPELYTVLYLSDAAAGAVAESFGRFPEWTAAILAGSPSLPGSVPGIARFRLADDAPLRNLDDPRQLLKLNLRPSEVVSRDYIRTRAWAGRIYREGASIGVRWWSYYDPGWASIGLWDRRQLVVLDVRQLRLDDEAVIAASRTIFRRIVEVASQ